MNQEQIEVIFTKLKQAFGRLVIPFREKQTFDMQVVLDIKQLLWDLHALVKAQPRLDRNLLAFLNSIAATLLTEGDSIRDLLLKDQVVNEAWDIQDRIEHLLDPTDPPPVGPAKPSLGFGP